ncbi:MAG: hypothetical protein ACKV0T_16090, partial [Planctomycetales bacterium]
MNRAFEVDPVLLRSLRDQFGLSEVEHFILAAAHIDPGDPRRLYYAAAELASRIPGAGPISVLEATEAIKSCLARKLLQVVTEETILHAKSRVAKASAIGPLNGWPFPGEITFTESGWELFVLLYRRIAECAPAVSEFVPYAPSTRWRQFDLCLQIFLDRTAAMAYQDSLGFCYEQLLCPVMSVGDLRPFAWDEATEAFAMLV